MKQIEQALKTMGLSWADVWALSLDRRAGTLVVVTADGRKVSGRLNDERRTTSDERRTTSDERRTTNDERRTTNDERRTTNDERPTDHFFIRNS